LKNIFDSGELQEDSVCAIFAHTARDGKKYQTKFYSLEAIIAVGYRVNSERGTQFRQWAITILQKYIHKGFAIDSYRFKYGSRFSTRFFDDLLEEIRDIHSSERNEGLYQNNQSIAVSLIIVDLQKANVKFLSLFQLGQPGSSWVDYRRVFRLTISQTSFTNVH